MGLIILSVLAGLAALTILLLAVPFDLAFRLDAAGRVEYRLQWKWCFGLISRNLDFKPGGRHSGPKQSSQGWGINQTLSGLRTILQLLQIEGLLRQLWRLIRGTLRHLKIKHLEADCLIGLEDPAETFYVFALMEPLNRLINYFWPGRVNLRTSFESAACEGHVDLVLRLFPVQLILPVMRFTFSRPVLRLIKKGLALIWKKHRPHWKIQSQPAV